MSSKLYLIWLTAMLIVPSACSQSPTNVTPNSPAMVVTSCVPQAALIGDTIHFFGHGFGTDTSGLSVLIGNKKATVISLVDSVMIVIVPAGADSGNVGLTRGSQHAVFPHHFKLLQTNGVVMIITACVPRIAMIGDTLQFIGHGFGTNTSGLSVLIGNKKATVISLLDSVMIVVIPAGADTGNVQLNRGNQHANFPYLFRLLPTSGVVMFRDSGYSSVSISVNGIYGKWGHIDTHNSVGVDTTYWGLGSAQYNYWSGSARIRPKFSGDTLTINHEFYFSQSPNDFGSFVLSAIYDSAQALFKDISITSSYGGGGSIKPQKNNDFSIHAKNVHVLMSGQTVMAVISGPAAISGIDSLRYGDYSVPLTSGLWVQQNDLITFGHATNST